MKLPEKKPTKGMDLETYFGPSKIIFSDFVKRENMNTSQLPKQCPCGKESSSRFRWCEECLKIKQGNIDSLMRLLQNSHRGAGGGAICICGAGCGGTSACSALSLLKQAMNGDDSLRVEVAELFGWH